MDNQRLSNHGDELENNSSSTGFVKRDTNDRNEEEGASDPTPTNLTVRIKTMDERVHRIEVNIDEKVSELKIKIRDQMNVPLEKQRLIYTGKQLKDEQTLRQYNISDDVCILLVANRVQNQNEAQRQAEANDHPSENLDLPSFIFNALNETAQMRRNRRLLFQQNARSFLRNIRLNISQSRETIVQNIASTELLIDS